MGINSVGHRLMILKSVYDVKKAQDVPIEDDHYMPLSTCLSPLYLVQFPRANRLDFQSRRDRSAISKRYPQRH